MRAGLIYKIQNTINGKCYIGQTIQDFERRKYYHLWSIGKPEGKSIHRAMKKYGIENFIFQIIDKDISLDDLNNAEISYIDKYDSYLNGYNENKGGGSQCGWIPSEETKRKIRIANTGKKHSEEAKAKMSASRTGKGNAMYGKTHTDEVKKRLSEARSSQKGQFRGSYKKHTCPHCGKVGGGGNMKRYHFDNCSVKQGC